MGIASHQLAADQAGILSRFPMLSVGWWENPELLLLKLRICSSIIGSTWIGAARSHLGWFGLCCCAVPELFTEKNGILYPNLHFKE